MNLFKTLLIMCAALSVKVAEGSSTAAASVADSDEASESSVQLKPSITVGGGSSSNVGRLRVEEGGTFARISPLLEADISVSDSVVVSSSVGGDFKRFTNQAAKGIGDESSGDFRSLVLYFLNESWELGGDIGASYSDSKSPYQKSSSETSAQEQRYFQPQGRVFLSWQGSLLGIEGGASGKNRSYSTVTNDRGNSFKGDFDQTGFDFKITAPLGALVKLSGKAAFESKNYKDRPADFTDGAASTQASRHPILQESAKDFTLGVEVGNDSFKSTTSPGFRSTKDRIFGARDSSTWKLSQVFAITVARKVSWNPAISLSRESFERFRSAPEVDPFGSPLRKDLDFKASSPFKISVGKNTQLLAEYAFSRRDSNYANSSYSDHTLSAGISLSM